MPVKKKVITWDDLDKKKYLIINPALFFFVRFALYPTSLVKTRLQVQGRDGAYKGTFHAFRSIFRQEGIRGFYKVALN
jgi:hypothetical protein